MRRSLLAIGAVVALMVGSTATVTADPPADVCVAGDPGLVASVPHAILRLDLAGPDLVEYLHKVLFECPS